MAGDIKADRLLFIRQQDILGPFFQIRQLSIGMSVLGDDLLGTEERLLAGFPFTLNFLAVLHGLF